MWTSWFRMRSCIGIFVDKGSASYGMPVMRGVDRLGNLLRTALPKFTKRAYRSDLAILPIVAPTGEFHQCMSRIPAEKKISICGNHCNQTKDIDMASRSTYSTQLDVSHLHWSFSEMETTRLFLNSLGIDAQTQEIWPELWTASEDSRAADNWLPQSPAVIRLGIAPGYSNPHKRLSSQWFVDVLKQWSPVDYQVVLLGNRSDSSVCAEISSAIGDVFDRRQVLNLAGKTNALGN